MTTNYTEILKTWTDEMLTLALPKPGASARDGNGNLRSSTEAEDAFMKALHAERRRRGL